MTNGPCLLTVSMNHLGLSNNSEAFSSELYTDRNESLEDMFRRQKSNVNKSKRKCKFLPIVPCLPSHEYSSPRHIVYIVTLKQSLYCFYTCLWPLMFPMYLLT